MAPRTIGEIFSFLNSDTANFSVSYIGFIDEICSHPKDLLFQSFSSVQECDIFKLRECLFIEILEMFDIESFASINIALDNENPLVKNLRKRYKPSTCLEDIYIFSITVCEKQLHKDLSKAILSSKTTSNPPTLSCIDKTVLSSVKDTLDQIKALRRENKEIKDELRSLQVKSDEQSKLILSLKNTNEDI